jgi:hypothetical protein
MYKSAIERRATSLNTVLDEAMLAARPLISRSA